MNSKAMAMMVVATGMLLGSAAYAQDAHDHGASKSGPDATRGHEAHCCKPDPNDMKGMQGMAGHGHDHAPVPKKPAAKKPAPKPAADAGPPAK